MSIAKLTVMVSLYNSGDYIENRLHNILESSLTDMEVWCVNADSPDKRDHDIPQKFPVKYIKLPKRNTVYEAWNYIIENSDSTYIANANTDDLIHPQGYQKLLQTIENADKSFGFVYPNWYTTAIPNQKWSSLTKIDSSGRPGQYNGDIDRSGVGHFPIWRRSLHSQVGLFDTRFRAAADAEWWARCYYKAKAKFLWVNEFLACYLWKNGQNLWHKEITSEEWNLYHKCIAEYRNANT